MLPQTKFAQLPAWAHEADGGVTYPARFVAAGVASGVKKRGKLDLAVLASEVPSVSAATFTGNAAAAAPVCVTRDTCDCDRLRAVVVNAGNANACTGEQGMADAERMRALAAEQLEMPLEQVAVASTGRMCVPLPMPRIEAGIAAATGALAADADADFASAILTTDQGPRTGALDVELPEGTVRLGVAAKGCGMISPNMATMLAFVTCDAVLTAEDWRQMLRAAVAASFNRITVDGQESTNDMVLGLCNGASGVEPGAAGLEQLAAALRAAVLPLAIAMAADGEGATHTMRLTVTGAADDAQAEAVARAVANSPLVKTAFFGRDPNWGRVLQAVGQALGRAHGSLLATVAYEGIVLVEAGQPVALDETTMEDLLAAMHEPEIDLSVRLAAGAGTAVIYFSDLTHDYVTLNAEYST